MLKEVENLRENQSVVTLSSVALASFVSVAWTLGMSFIIFALLTIINIPFLMAGIGLIFFGCILFVAPILYEKIKARLFDLAEKQIEAFRALDINLSIQQRYDLCHGRKINIEKRNEKSEVNEVESNHFQFLSPIKRVSKTKENIFLLSQYNKL